MPEYNDFLKQELKRRLEIRIAGEKNKALRGRAFATDVSTITGHHRKTCARWMNSDLDDILNV